jgi:hypothetical protein
LRNFYVYLTNDSWPTGNCTRRLRTWCRRPSSDFGRCGDSSFSSHSYFTTAFHDYFGMSPKEFALFYSQEENKEALQKLLE